MSLPKGAEKALREHFKIPKKVQQQIAGANADLYYGPLSKADARDHGIKGWRGYSHALDVIQDWIADKIPSEMFYNADFEGLSDREEEGYQDEETGEWVEPFLENTYRLERHDILSALLGSELARNL